MIEHRQVVTKLYAEIVGYQKELEQEQLRIEKAQAHVSNLMAAAETWRQMIAENRAAIAALEAS